jgi:hypothetical protein
MKYIFSFFSIYHSFKGYFTKNINAKIEYHNSAYNRILDNHHDYIEITDLKNINNSYLYSNITNSIISNQYYKNIFFRKVRITQFYSEDKYMINSLWYPHYVYDAPILSVDVAKFNANSSLCFLNLGEINKNQFSHLFSPFLKKNNLFVENKTKHLLQLNDIVSDSMIYTHIYDNAKLEKIPDLISEYIDIYLSTLNYCNVDINTKKMNEIKEVHKKYDEIRKKNEQHFLYQNNFDKKELNIMINSMYE